jgi:renalase
MTVVGGRVAIVGAGLAGLACARTLADAGLALEIFEKSRGPGGRVSTRREVGIGTFDHGAAFFTVREPAFAARVAALEAEGIVDAFAPRYAHGKEEVGRLVAVPGMNALGRALEAGLDTRYETRIVELLQEPGGWWLHDESGSRYGPYGAVVVALPAPQAVPLLVRSPALAAQAAEAEFAPCWAVMAAWNVPLPLDCDAYHARGSELSWAAREGAKPGRGSGERWVLHAAPDWSAQWLEASPEEVIALLLPAFARLAGESLPPPSFVKAHRWRYARVLRPVGRKCLYDEPMRLAACGDWCLGPRIEDAYMSGLAAGEHVLSWLAPERLSAAEPRP